MKTSCSIVVLLLLFVRSVEAQNWQPLSNARVNGVVYVMYSDTISQSLYVGGDFDSIDVNGDLRSIALWKNNQWSAVGTGLNDSQWPASLRDISVYDERLYAGGFMTDANGTITWGIAQWDGDEWNGVDGGLTSYNGNFPGQALALRNISDELYVCGRFVKAGNLTVNGLAKWNGSNWSNVHDFPFFDAQGDVITDCAIYNGELYVVGDFNGGVNNGMLGITKWDGNNWVGVGSVGVGQANCLAVFEDKLYVAGTFSSEMNPIFPGNHVVSWDGNAWDNLGGGLGGPIGNVHRMMVHGEKLYVVGDFLTAGGISAMGIATWDGVEWCDLGSTSDNGMLALTSFEDTVYIGGGFTELNGNEIYSIAKSGGSPFDENCGTLSVIEHEESNAKNLILYPNPTTSKTTLTWHSQHHVIDQCQLMLYDARGKLMCSETLSATGESSVIDLSGYAKGVYFGQLLVGETKKSFKVVKE